MICNSNISIDNGSHFTIKGKRFKGTQGLWDLLTRKNVNTGVITEYDLKKYRMILEMTNANLERYESGGNIQTSRGSKFRYVIAKVFPQTRRRGVEAALRQKLETY